MNVVKQVGQALQRQHFGTTCTTTFVTTTCTTTGTHDDVVPDDPQLFECLQQCRTCEGGGKQRREAGEAEA